MKMVNKVPRRIDNSRMWLIAVAQDSGKYYGAIVDPNTYKCYVEEMGVRMRKENLVGEFIRVPVGQNDEEWKTAVNYFEKHQVFAKFLEGRNTVWAKEDGQLTSHAQKLKQKLSI
jgi:hypothetical protein